MKKVLLGVILLTSLTLAGCTSGDSAKSEKMEKTIESLKKENENLNSKLKALSTEGDTSENIIFSSVGTLQYTITSIKTDEIENKQENYTNAEYNFQAIDTLPKEYYRTKINYNLKNIGNKPFSLGSYQAGILNDEDIEYTGSGSEKYLFDENSNGVIQPGTSSTGSFYLISSEPPKITNFKINISKQFSDNTEEGPIGAAGIAKMSK
nr:MAG TPA: Protein of unknown function (DUF3138) [Caudoviricetes sp.]